MTAIPTFLPAPDGDELQAASQNRPGPPGDLIELGLEDEWLHAVTYVEVGPDGERVDKRDYVTNWEKTIRSAVKDDPIIRKVSKENLLTEEEEKALADELNRPEMYFNEDNLRRAYRNPGGNLIDFIKAALGSLKIKPPRGGTDRKLPRLAGGQIAHPPAGAISLPAKEPRHRPGKYELDDLFQPAAFHPERGRTWAWSSSARRDSRKSSKI